jgi:hypothetical protein
MLLEMNSAVLYLPIASQHISSRTDGPTLLLGQHCTQENEVTVHTLQGYFHGEDWSTRVGTPFCLVPSGSGNALAANCGLWTPQAIFLFLKKTVF